MVTCEKEALGGGAKKPPAITGHILSLSVFDTKEALLGVVSSLSNYTPLGVMLRQ